MSQSAAFGSPNVFFGSCFLAVCFWGNVMAAADDGAIRNAVTFYASFDDAVTADFGAGGHAPSIRFDHPTEKGKFVVEPGFNEKVFSIAKTQGVHGGALQATDVMPRRGRLFFPAQKNLPFNPNGWGGTVSLWINTDPNTQLKTPFCDPVQITERGANDGGLWIDFPDTKPRDMRLGAFPAAAAGEKPIQESAPDAPLVWLKEVGFKTGAWHHLAITWKNFDTGKKDAEAVLYVDGKRIGALQDRDIAMRWDMSRAGIYVAVNYIGLLDEFSLFSRPLEAAEVARLHAEPSLLTVLKPQR